MENIKIKQRLVGAAVLISIGVIFLPLFFQSADEFGPGLDDDVIPPKPPGLSVKVLPLNVPERVEPKKEAAEKSVDTKSPDVKKEQSAESEKPGTPSAELPKKEIAKPKKVEIKIGS